MLKKNKNNNKMYGAKSRIILLAPRFNFDLLNYGRLQNVLYTRNLNFEHPIPVYLIL